MSAMDCRVLIVDDDDLFAELLVLLLQGHDGIDVVGRARDGSEGVELAKALKPDVVTMDLEMPRLNGIEAAERICDLDDPPRVIVVSSSLFNDAVAEARRVGARGFVTKSRVQDELVRVVFAACRGDAFQEVA